MKSIVLHDDKNSQLGCCTVVLDHPAVCGAGQTFDNGANICRCDVPDQIINADGDCEACPPNHSYDSGKILSENSKLKDSGYNSHVIGYNS